MQRIQTLSQALLVLGLASLSVIGPAPAAARSSAPDVVEIDDASEATVRKNGEIRLKLNQTFERGDQVYRVSLAFAGEADLNKVRSQGIDIIDLTNLDSQYFVDSNGEIVEQEKRGISLVDIGDAADRTLCSTTVARGFKQLTNDVRVAVDIHTRLARLPDPDITLEVVDPWGDCDIFLLSQCSGGCYNAFSNSDGEHWLEARQCAVFGGRLDSYCYCL